MKLLAGFTTTDEHRAYIAKLCIAAPLLRLMTDRPVPYNFFFVLFFDEAPIDVVNVHCTACGALIGSKQCGDGCARQFIRITDLSYESND